MGQGQLRDIIYIDVEELEYIMLYAKYHDYRTLGEDYRRRCLKVFTIYGHCGHIGHVTWTIYINFHPPFPRRLHMIFYFHWPGGFREEDVLK